MTFLKIYLLTTIAIVFAIGCGAPGEQMAEARISAYQSYDEAEKAFLARDYATAEPKYAAALSGGGLNADLYSDALVKHALCLAVGGKTSEASAALDKLEPEAINLDQIYVARSFIFKKQGKAAESRAALAKARQYNRTVQEFKE